MDFRFSELANDYAILTQKFQISKYHRIITFPVEELCYNET
jgi:hypothetical protein